MTVQTVFSPLRESHLRNDLSVNNLIDLPLKLCMGIIQLYYEQDENYMNTKTI